MKKCIVGISIFIFTLVALTSCGHSIQSDAKEMAQKTCEASKLMQRLFAGDNSAAKDLRKITKESEELSADIKKRYTSEKDKKAFQEEYIKDLQNCK